LKSNNQKNKTKYIKISPRIIANIEKIKNKMMEYQLISTRSKPIAKSKIFNAEDSAIIRYFNKIANNLLSFYRCCDNFNVIKGLVNYHLKFSLLYTLMSKHKLKSLHRTYKKYSKNIKTENQSYIDSIEVTNLQKKFLTIDQPITNEFY
jgi:hypothetical protein